MQTISIVLHISIIASLNKN